MNGEGYIRIWKNEKLRHLYREDHDALALLLLIMDRARWSDGWNAYGLSKGQCILGRTDVEKHTGLTEKRYRTAKKNLADLGAATFAKNEKGAKRGANRFARVFTVVTLSNEIFCGDSEISENSKEGEPKGEPRANQGRQT